MSSLSMRPAQAPPDQVRDLSQAEHLVLFGFRAAALGHVECPAVRRVFLGLLGGEADGALCELLILVRTIGWTGARRVRLHAPGCCAVSEDEGRILRAITAAQRSLASGREEALRGAMTDLLNRPACEASLMAVQRFAASLILGGLHLPVPPEGHVASRTLH